MPLKWTNLFNVHKCTNSSSIPVLVAKLTSGAFTEVDTHTLTLNGDTNKPVIFCLNISTKDTIKVGLTITSATTDKIDVMLHCGLAVININKFNAVTFDNTGYSETAAADDTKDHMGCIACKPGYKPTATAVNLARTCTKITNCKDNVTHTIFNGCSECETGYTWASDDNGNIDYGSCVKIITNNLLTNCIGYKTSTNDGKGKCIVCDVGYTLTIDGYCEELFLPICSGEYYPETTLSNLFTKNYLS